MKPFVFQILSRKQSGEHVQLDLMVHHTGYSNGSVRPLDGIGPGALSLHAKKKDSPEVFDEWLQLPMNTLFLLSVQPQSVQTQSSQTQSSKTEKLSLDEESPEARTIRSDLDKE